MVLKDVHETLDEIPENYRDLYTDKNGRWEITGIEGVKTQGDLNRLQKSLDNSTAINKKMQTKIDVWADLDYEDTIKKLDRMGDLEQAAEGKLDDAAIDELATKRGQAWARTQVAPLEREIRELTQKNSDLTEVNGKLTASAVRTKIKDRVDKALSEAKVLAWAREDAHMHAQQIFEIREDDGHVVTRDEVGVTPGMDPTAWLTEIQDKKRPWWGESMGGGSQGSGAGSAGFVNKNPWSAEHWNMTEQSRLFKDSGMERCEQLAKAAGTTLGGPMPRHKNSA